MSDSDPAGICKCHLDPAGGKLIVLQCIAVKKLILGENQEVGLYLFHIYRQSLNLGNFSVGKIYLL